MRGNGEKLQDIKKLNKKYLNILKVMSMIFGWVHIIIGVLGTTLSFVLKTRATNYDYYIYTIIFGVLFNCYVELKSKQKLNNCVN